MTSALRTDLQAFTVPTRYGAAFRNNVTVLSDIGQRPAIAALISSLEAVTGLTHEDLTTDLQRYLLTAFEYRGSQLDHRRGGATLRLGALAVYATPRRRTVAAPADVLVDDWYRGSAGTFYGEALLANLAAHGRVIVEGVSTFHDIDARELAGALRHAPALRSAVRSVQQAEGLDLTHHTFRVVRDGLAGRELRRRFGASTILSGNDNGFSLLLARAAGARLVLVQNGRRGLLSDSAFIAADALAAMEAGRAFGLRAETGCRFGTVAQVGSIRLDSHLRSTTRHDAPPTNDVLFVSGLEPDGTAGADGGLFDAWYSMRAERATIGAVTALARDMRVGYYPRHDDEVSMLRREGLYDSRVEYLTRSVGGVYTAMENASLVVSSGSTTGVEALAMGRHAGFVNLSANETFNSGFAEYGLECTDAPQLAAFVADLVQRPLDPERFVIQSPTLPQDIADLI